MCNYAQMQIAVSVATERLALLKEKYSELKPYLVLSSPYGQIDIHADPVHILKDFPKMVVDSPEKTKALGILTALKQAEIRKDSEKQIPRLTAELAATVPALRFKGDTNIEFRFGHLVYKLIRQLKQESGIDRELTMQSDASIRVIMGTVAELAVEQADGNAATDDLI